VCVSVCVCVCVYVHVCVCVCVFMCAHAPNDEASDESQLFTVCSKVSCMLCVFYTLLCVVKLVASCLLRMIEDFGFVCSR